MSRYEWPLITVIHPDHGSYEMHIHGVMHPDGVTTLVAFTGGVARAEQVAMVNGTAAGTGGTIRQLRRSQISEELGIFLAAQFHARPDTDVVIAPGGEWGIGR